MSKIVLRFVGGQDLGSEVIEWFGHGLVSHVDAVMPPFTAGADLLGARYDGGVKIRPFDYANFTRVVRLELDATEDEAAGFYSEIRGEVGKPYDRRGILAFALGRDWRDPSAWFCSELVAAMLER